MGIDFATVQDILQGRVFGIILTIIGLIVLATMAMRGKVKEASYAFVVAVIGGIIIFGGVDLFRGIGEGTSDVVSGVDSGGGD